MRICSPHCGIDPETTSGGETYEREVLRHLGVGGMAIEILLARHKRYPEDVPNWTIRRLPIGRGLRWPVAPFVMAPAIKRAWDAQPFDLLRAHSLRYVGPATLIARRRYRLDVPGKLGWLARYLKDVSPDETTVRFWQEIYDDAGKLAETHEKFPVDKGHRKV